MPEPTQTVLAIVEEPELQIRLRSWAQHWSLEPPVFAPSAMEGIAFYESFQPDLVLIEGQPFDMPINLLVPALKQLEGTTPIWILGREPRDPSQLPQGLHGRLPEDFNLVDPNTLKTPMPGFLNEDIDQTLSNAEDAIMIGGVPIPKIEEEEGLQLLEADQLPPDRVFNGEGNFKIIGNLVGMKRIQIKGDLQIIGTVKDSHIQCEGDLKISEGIRGTGNGVFCRGTLETGFLDHALVVCGANLFLKGTCVESIVNVTGRMVGIGAHSAVIGGRIRVGQHLNVNEIGSPDGTDTLIEMAPAILKKAFKPPQIKFDLPNQSREPFLQPPKLEELADIAVETIFPGLTIRIGTQEDLIVSKHDGGLRIFLSEGILIEKRAKQTLHLPPQD